MQVIPTNREIYSCVPTAYTVRMDEKIYFVTLNLDADGSKSPTEPLIEMQERSKNHE